MAGMTAHTSLQFVPRSETESCSVQSIGFAPSETCREALPNPCADFVVRAKTGNSKENYGYAVFHSTSGLVSS